MDTSILHETLEEIETVITESELAVERGEYLKELKNSKAFQSVIIEGYINTESKKLFKILTDPSGASPYSNEQSHLMLGAISHFKSYIGTEDYQGTVEQDAMYGVEEIQREQDYRKTITAANAEDEEV